MIRVTLFIACLALFAPCNSSTLDQIQAVPIGSTTQCPCVCRTGADAQTQAEDDCRVQVVIPGPSPNQFNKNCEIVSCSSSGLACCMRSPSPTPSLSISPTISPSPSVSPTISVSPSPSFLCRPNSVANEEISAHIRLDRVRRCTRKLWCRSKLTRHEYRHFTSLRRSTQKKLYLSEIRVPNRENTRNLILGFSGQQDYTFSGALSSGVTGQPNGYGPFHRRQGSRNIHLMNNRLIQQVSGSAIFPKDETFVGIVADTRFQYQFWKKTRNKLLNSYMSYIHEKLSPTKSIQTIYLAGHSRGGCLAILLAKRLAKKYTTTRIVVHTFDPVCREDDPSEFGIFYNKIQNPTRSDSWVHGANFPGQFSEKQCLSIRNFLSGGRIIGGPLKGIRAFGHVHISPLYYQSRKWYQQSFYPQGHISIDDYYHGQAISHLHDSVGSMQCPCGI